MELVLAGELMPAGVDLMTVRHVVCLYFFNSSTTQMI